MGNETGGTGAAGTGAGRSGDRNHGRRHELSHVGPEGDARMVDVGDKAVTIREAKAGGRVSMRAETLRLLEERALPKGDVLATARVAGIMAAKKTAELVPMCHPLQLSVVEIGFEVTDEPPAVEIVCRVRTEGRTGVEMEALTGVSVAALTVYDMAKAVDREMVIEEVRLLSKSGGKEDYVREEKPPSDETARGGTEVRRDDEVQRGRIVSVNISPGKGERKTPVDEVRVEPEHGIVGDGHAGEWHRQVSLLAQESIQTMVEKGLDVGPGDFAENLTTEGIDLPGLPVGTRLASDGVLMEVTQIGKECHDRCAIYYQAGDCVMPREGIFVRVLAGGVLRPGDPLRVVETIDDASGSAPPSEPFSIEEARS